jgi:hypothetical protein
VQVNTGRLWRQWPQLPQSELPFHSAWKVVLDSVEADKWACGPVQLTIAVAPDAHPKGKCPLIHVRLPSHLQCVETNVLDGKLKNLLNPPFVIVYTYTRGREPV